APADDLLSAMLAAESSEDRLSHDEIVDNAVFSFFAGFETTTNLIGNGCAALAAHPHELGRLYERPSLVAPAVEEFLRYDAPVQGVARIVKEPLEVAGRMLRPGRVLVLLMGSANRDERVFEHPELLDVGREPGRQVSFGGGIHYCMGAALSRVEARTAFARLLARTSALEPAAAPVRNTTSSFRAFSSLPLRVQAR
ncbi:MAG TPA: cytochrome P450, partial [Solirubrobacteraceae bacterium]|nr:cytochrome P450 [Solirubrobacteraceae bacterium]